MHVAGLRITDGLKGQINIKKRTLNVMLNTFSTYKMCLFYLYLSLMVLLKLCSDTAVVHLFSTQGA